VAARISACARTAWRLFPGFGIMSSALQLLFLLVIIQTKHSLRGRNGQRRCRWTPSPCVAAAWLARDAHSWRTRLARWRRDSKLPRFGK